MSSTRITWLGHSTVLVQSPSTTLLIDPYIAQNPSFPKNFALPEKIDFILLTHAHNDHLSDAPPLAAQTGATIVAIHELALYLAAHGAASTIGMNLGGTVAVGDVKATMVEAKHSTSIQDADGVHYAGVAAGFVLAMPGGAVVYHAGDTAVFGDMRLIGELYQPTIALLPIGGHYTMGPREAALAVGMLGVPTVLPIHFGTFPVLTGTPEALAALTGSSVEIIRWKPGESYSA